MINKHLTQALLDSHLRASNELQLAYVSVVLKYLDSTLDEACEFAEKQSNNHILAYHLLNNMVHKEIKLPHTIEEAIVKDHLID